MHKNKLVLPPLVSGGIMLSYRGTNTCRHCLSRCSPRQLLYLPHMYDLLSEMPDDGTHTLERFCKWTGMPKFSEMIPLMYQVIPSGRAAQALRRNYPRQPAESYRGQNCRSQLLNTSHFHIDHNGDLFTGLCAGIAAATIEDLHPRITPRTNPIFSILCDQGPFGLMEMAIDRCGFRSKRGGYVSMCDLCFDVRCSLQQSGEFPELRPTSFYLAE